MPDETRSSEGPPSEAAVISREMVKLLRELAGRGPTKARTTIGRDHVLVMLHDSLTPADKLLASAGYGDKVHATRQALQDVMRPRAIRLVEETLRRSVVSFLSANHLDPDVAAEVFVLGPLEDGATGRVSEGEASREEPGRTDGERPA
jgi:uncharacterized protein YbcI